ncbi:MAG: TFIIB-type zinc ribbon-containing protein, partial [Planctomycetota bacterium]
MRECPLCRAPLDRVRYEGFPVHECSGCGGILVEKKRISQIRRKMETSPEELVEEAKTERAEDTARDIRCPR